MTLCYNVASTCQHQATNNGWHSQQHVREMHTAACCGVHSRTTISATATEHCQTTQYNLRPPRDCLIRCTRTVVRGVSTICAATYTIGPCTCGTMLSNRASKPGRPSQVLAQPHVCSLLVLQQVVKVDVKH